MKLKVLYLRLRCLKNGGRDTAEIVGTLGRNDVKLSIICVES